MGLNNDFEVVNLSQYGKISQKVLNLIKFIRFTSMINTNSIDVNPE